jgi:hypothetical protein
LPPTARAKHTLDSHVHLLQHNQRLSHAPQQLAVRKDTPQGGTRVTSMQRLVTPSDLRGLHCQALMCAAGAGAGASGCCLAAEDQSGTTYNMLTACSCAAQLLLRAPASASTDASRCCTHWLLVTGHPASLHASCPRCTAQSSNGADCCLGPSPVHCPPWPPAAIGQPL